MVTASNGPLILPGLRGQIGDWVYYSCLMSISDIGQRVDYAQTIHTDNALSRLIQRRLEGKRSLAIAQYLTKTKERFFNALVFATYDGRPEWLDLGQVEASSPRADSVALPQTIIDTIGFLHLQGSERIFAVDGQHRLAGIKRAMEEGASFGNERLPVIFVAHKEDERERTRRLFTTLNKSAKPVAKADIIALDEDDAMAIIARRLVEDHSEFASPKILLKASDAMPKSNTTALTTLGNLYDLLRVLFQHATGKANDRNLRFHRPTDGKLEEYERLALDYFKALSQAFPDLGNFFNSDDPGSVTEQLRGSFGGHILFRPVGLKSFTTVAAAYAKHHHITLPDAALALQAMPTSMAAPPYVRVIWDPERQRMIPPGKSLMTELMAHMAGLGPDDSSRLHAKYAQAIGEDPADTELPGRVV